MASITWGRELAEVYDQIYAAQSAAPVLGHIAAPGCCPPTRPRCGAAGVVSARCGM
jgi:hypothetical protein